MGVEWHPMTWRAVSAGPWVRAGAYDVSYGSRAAEHFAALAVGDQPETQRGVEASYTQPEDGWREMFVHRFCVSRWGC